MKKGLLVLVFLIASVAGCDDVDSSSDASPIPCGLLGQPCCLTDIATFYCYDPYECQENEEAICWAGNP